MYEARLTAYEAFCGVAAKYEAPLTRYEAKALTGFMFFCPFGQKNGRGGGDRTLDFLLPKQTR